MNHNQTEYSGSCILRPPIQPEKSDLKLKMVLKWKDIYTEYRKVVLLMASLKYKRSLQMERFLIAGTTVYMYGHVTVMRNVF